MSLSQRAHIVSAYGAELDQLADDIARMGGLVETQLTEALSAFVRRNAATTAEVRAREKQVNAMYGDIEKSVIRLFALRQPMATDLRMTISALKIASDLERVGDLAKNIAYRGEDMAEFAPPPVLGQVERLGAIVTQQLQEVLDALGSFQIEPALRVWHSDDEVDEHYNSLIADVLTSMKVDSNFVGPGHHVLFVAKNLERIGDHATNIAEAVHFMVTGQHLEQIETTDPSAGK